MMWVFWATSFTSIIFARGLKSELMGVDLGVVDDFLDFLHRD
jgi:hypothetical protein